MLNKIVMFVALCGANLALFGLSASAQAPNTDYPGLVLAGNSETSRDQLVAHIGKCRSDSRTFLAIVDSVATRTDGTLKLVRFEAYTLSAVIIGLGGDLGEMLVDLSDLEVLPDPIRNGRFGPLGRPLFDPIESAPAWATTVCGWLGHEIIEMLENVMDGKPDRKVHHYEIANAKEDAIIADYYRVNRDRDEDCWTTHLGHDDILIDLGFYGVERFHLSPPKVQFGSNGQVYGNVPSGRLGYVEYQVNATFPGRRKGSTLCKS